DTGGESHRGPDWCGKGIPPIIFYEATSGALPGEEWGRFVHICDHINATAEGPKDAVKALKKKLFKNYNHKEIRFTLSVSTTLLVFN
uniref:VHS domain-containing protein n=1 Tax=Crocodylus porosus TaxID=8502 RepID=A0A7M4E240_CROPO